MVRKGNNIVMVKSATPQEVVSTNFRKFVARYGRMAGDSLPTNTPIMRKYKKRRRGRRVRRGTVFKIFAKNIFGKIEKFEARNRDKMLVIEDEKR